MTMPGGATNALNYPTTFVLLGNGQGFGTEKAAFGFPAGGLGPDNRFYWYVGDSWKVKPNLTLTYGLRYMRDSGRTDSDLPGIAALNQFNNQFYSGLGNRVNNPNLNFAPQLGIAWGNNGKTVVRGGIGLFYENSVWNNVLFDRPARLTRGPIPRHSTCMHGWYPSDVYIARDIVTDYSRLLWPAHSTGADSDRFTPGPIPGSRCYFRFGADSQWRLYRDCPG